MRPSGSPSRKGPRILVFRNGHIGNTLVCVPLLRALKDSLNARVAVLVDPMGHELLAGLPFVDECIVYDKRGADRGLTGWLRLVARLRRGRYDVAVVVKRFLRNEVIAFGAGIPRRVGFRTPGTRSFTLTETVPYVEGRNVVDLNLDLLGPLGGKAVSDRLEIAFSPADRRAADEFLERQGLQSGSFFCCHFGGQTVAGQRWEPSRYARLCEDLHGAFGRPLVLLAGPGEEAFAGEVLAAAGSPAAGSIRLGAGLGLKAAACLIESAFAFVGNDSGPSHLADAVGTRGVILFAGGAGVQTQVAKWKPKGEAYMPVYSRDGTMDGITPADVVASVRLLFTD